MLVESSYGWLVAPDPAARARVQAHLDIAFRELAVASGLPTEPPSYAAFESDYLVERYVANPQPLYSRLPFDYRLVPGPVRNLGLAVLERLHRGGDQAPFPGWPLERRADELRARVWAAAAAAAGVVLQDPTYPGGKRGAVVLTHDVDSRAEIDGIPDLLAAERRHGLPSAFGFIPTVSWPARSLFERLLEDGCEVYCHDVRHDSKLAYASESSIRASLEQFFRTNSYARPAVRAFRSGQLLMTRTLLSVLGDWFDVDLSIPDTERGGPYGAAAGCATVYPFTIDGLTELPLSMPQDFYLTNVESYDSARMLSVWREKLDAILAAGGVAVINTHPRWTRPGRAGNWAAYEGLLSAIESADAWVTTPSELRDWLASRGAEPASSLPT